MGERGLQRFWLVCVLQAGLQLLAIFLISNSAHTQDWLNPNAFVWRNGTKPLTANWDAGSFEIRAQTFYSDIATGTAPFTVASTTVVANLNADKVDGSDASAFAAASHTHPIANITNFGFINIAFDINDCTNAFPNTSCVFTHNLGRQFVIVQCYDENNTQVWPYSIILTNTTQTTVSFKGMSVSATDNASHCLFEG